MIINCKYKHNVQINLLTPNQCHLINAVKSLDDDSLAVLQTCQRAKLPTTSNKCK